VGAGGAVVISNYRLRSLALDEDRLGCRFDATPTEFGLLGDGTRELIQDFLLNQRIEASPTQWSIKPFWTYYYTQFPHSKDFSDVFPRTFEVRVRFAERFDAPAPTDPFGENYSPAVDPTWDSRLLPLDWTRQRFIIVADCFKRSREELLASLDQREKLKASVKTVELVALHPHVLQMRMDVGEAQFPDDQPHIYSLMEEASHFCRSFTWKESVKLGGS
jgi:hypothetical protein